MVENIYRQISLHEGKPFNIMEVIRDAAAVVDRPLFYAVAVIVASFLPIYVLSGPSGTLFKPMADTMIYALVGSLVVTLTLLPVLCALFMSRGIHARRNKPFEWIKAQYTRGLDYCLARPWGATIAAGVLLIVSLLFVPFIGAEFMPQLDEGSLWVRATMPYTISFDEARDDHAEEFATCSGRFQMSRLSRLELGRPVDDGTDATGFFQC